MTGAAALAACYAELGHPRKVDELVARLVS